MKAIKKLIDRAMNLGVTSGLTFHLDLEPGVGLMIVPNARLTRSNLNTVERQPEQPEFLHSRLKDRGFWQAKQIHVGDKHLGI